VSKNRQIHPSEYASNSYWKNDFLHKTTYKRGSKHNVIGMIIMWLFYGIIIAQLIHAFIVLPFFPIWATIFLILSLMSIVVIKGR
tara:strand:+ start:153 stop:407 length:255 start_codon:yes stop_codon:yes gene_type:complete